MKRCIKNAAILLLCLCVAALPGCQALTGQQRDSVRSYIQFEYENGNLTAAQRDAAIEAIDSDEPIDWASLGLIGANIALALVGGPMIVRSRLPLLGRGKPTQKVGLPASKVQQGA